MTIKVISLGLQSPNSTMNIIQRGGKRIVLALCITLEIDAENLTEVASTTPVTFSIEEVPINAAKALFAESDDEGDIGALVALENGKPVSDEATAAVREYVRRHVMSLPTVDFKRPASNGDK